MEIVSYSFSLNNLHSAGPANLTKSLGGTGIISAPARIINVAESVPDSVTVTKHPSTSPVFSAIRSSASSVSFLKSAVSRTVQIGLTEHTDRQAGLFPRLLTAV